MYYVYYVYYVCYVFYVYYVYFIWVFCVLHVLCVLRVVRVLRVLRVLLVSLLSLVSRGFLDLLKIWKVWVTDWLSDNLKSRDASASKKLQLSSYWKWMIFLGDWYHIRWIEMQLDDRADSGFRSTLLLVEHLQALNDGTKILIETDIKTFFPKPRLFFETKTETNTFFRDQISQSETNNFFWYQIFQNQNQDFFPRLYSSNPKPKPSKNWQKSWDRDRDQNQDFSISLTIFGEIFSKYFHPFPSLFFFSSRKRHSTSPYIFLLFHLRFSSPQR